MKLRELQKILQDFNYELVRVRGSHAIYEKADCLYHVTVPISHTDVNKMLAKKIIKQIVN